MDNHFTVTLEGLGIDQKGVLLDEFFEAVKGIQDALRLMVQHLGDREITRGQPPRWVRHQSRVRLTGVSHGSFVAELALEQPPGNQPYLENLGSRALDAMLGWDGTERSTLPKPVTDRLYAIPAGLSEGVQVWYGVADQLRKVEIRSREHTMVEVLTGLAEALLHGWLKEVNWDKRTAQLHGYAEEYVPLRFQAALDEEMLRLATQYVEVTGRGRFNRQDRWISVEIESIDGGRHLGEPFDLEEFLNAPNPRIFDPDRVVTASEPFDVDEFVRLIHEGREIGSGEPTD